MQLLAFAITSLFARLRSSERGQDLLEYALLGGLIAAAIIAVAGGIIFTGALEGMGKAIGHCIDFDKATGCTPI